MRSANHSAPLQGLRLYKALLGLIQASGLAGGFDCPPVGADDHIGPARKPVKFVCTDASTHAPL